MSKTETHFNISHIESISFWPMKQTDYQWFEEAQEVRYIFNLFVKRPYLKAGWDRWEFHKEYAEYDYDGSTSWWAQRRSTEYLEKHEGLVFIKENVNGKQWFEKAKIIVRKRGGNHQYVRTFESNEEAKKWVEHLKGQTSDNFEVIIHD